jgi:trimeric autotransporter adhesin
MSFHCMNRVKDGFSKGFTGSKRRNSLKSSVRGVEVLESRELLAVFAVTNLADSGAGSLRQAILNANAQPGADTIDFGVTGTIRVGRTSLPAITGTVNLDASTAPTFTGSPLVTVDFQGSQGLRFAVGADGSVLRSLSLVRAGNAGVTLDASHITVQGDYIGLRADGTTLAGNAGDGVKIDPSSHGDLIGRSDPVTGVTYYNADAVGMQPVSAWQGIRGTETAGQYLITGTSNSNGLLFIGSISGQGASYAVNYPGAATSSVYGPDDLGNGGVRLVGSYRNASGSNDPVTTHGFLFEGTTADLSSAANYRTIDYPGATYNYVHSTMGGLAVGNYDGPTPGGLPLGPGGDYIYDVAKGTFLTSIVYPGSLTNTAYGIWWNGGASYTICGGYSNQAVNNVDDQSRPIGQGYLVDYNAATGQFSNWKSFSDPTGLLGSDIFTHFEGISSVEKGVYTLSADSLQSGVTGSHQGSLVTVRRNPDGTFGDASWVNLNYPGGNSVVSSNSVYGNNVVGIVVGQSGVFSFQATVNTGFQLSNVISGNGGNGIGIYGSSSNQIAMNDIGTDASGTLGRGNAKNGILVTNGATGNLIGGQATGGNNPTASVFVRPPQGNLISGNGANGVLITAGATGTVLSGNFVGTTASGNASLGNRLDGVAIVNANGNQLIGCTFQQSPFVFYNVLSGNGGNGLRITNSNNTTVQANFMGVGANNATIVANGGDGLLVSGSSKNTQVGGVIPLGNVVSGNNRNGVEVRDTASGLVSFNTFTGIYAFGAAAPNRLDGVLITSSGGNNQIRTCIVSGNLGNGIELGGNATGVQVTDTAVGTNTSIQTAIPNLGSGIRISGNAHNNAIGGFQPSVEPQVTISSNHGYGIEIVGSAHNNVVFHTYIGTSFNDSADLGNWLGGIFMGPGTRSNTIGGSSAAFQNLILNSGGAGVIIQSSNGNAVLGNSILNNSGGGVVVFAGQNNVIGSAGAGNTIEGNGLNGLSISGLVTGTRVQGNTISGNAGNGVALSKARFLTIGGSTPGSGNVITGNPGYGLFALGVCSGTLVKGNAIVANTKGNVNLTGSRGIPYIPG